MSYKYRQVVFDIETYGLPFDDLSESQQEYLLRDAEKEQDPVLREKKTEDAKGLMALFPFTAKVIVIGFYIVDSGKTVVLYETPDGSDERITENDITYVGSDEKKLIENFWRMAAETQQLISFNGRGFDAPFMMLRSAKLGIKPSKNLVGYRYDTREHCDLLEQLSFYGAFRRFNLDFYCYSFGIVSPKSKGISGIDVKNFYEAGKIREVARYCADDVRATHELFKIWENYINIK
ncbi:MAG: ribonuclease H-like domain-containing protein [Ignavibacteriaceae bacterium]|nr:ribonuclease H-like domain-containing protein [Ignavibacteriaceae bacterium]